MYFEGKVNGCTFEPAEASATGDPQHGDSLTAVTINGNSHNVRGYQQVVGPGAAVPCPLCQGEGTKSGPQGWAACFCQGSGYDEGFV